MMERLEISEDLRQQNFSSFERKYGFVPAIARDENSRYYMVKARNGSPVLYIRGALSGGEDLRINSDYSPEYEAKVWADKEDVGSRRTTIALLGFSSGYFINALMERLRPDTTFFIYEPAEELFSFVCGFIDLKEIIENSRVTIYISDDQRKRYTDDMIREVTTFRPEVTGIVTPYYSEDPEFRNTCDVLGRVIESNKNFQADRGRKAFKARLFAWNHMRRSSFITDLEKRIPKGIPAVIVAAGPSLKKNVEVLKKLRGKALIICTDRASSVLDEHGIVPDLVTSADALKSAEYVKYHVLDEVPLLASYQTNSDTLRLFDGRTIFFHALWYENTLFGERAGDVDKGIDLGGNVAGASFVACTMLGIRTIILIGQDLAYCDGKHHADGRDEGVAYQEMREVPAVDGGTVLTNDMWLEFLDFYERQISMNPDIRLIDATEGGALIRGSEVMSLDDVVKNVCDREYDIDGIFSDMDKAQTDEEYEKMVGTLKNWISELDLIERNSRELTTMCAQLIKVCRYQDINDPKNENKLKKLDKLRLEIYKTTINDILEETWVEDMYSIPDYTFMMRTNEEALPVLENAMRYFEHLPQDCESLKAEIENAIREGQE